MSLSNYLNNPTFVREVSIVLEGHCEEDLQKALGAALEQLQNGRRAAAGSDGQYGFILSMRNTLPATERFETLA